VAQCFVGELDVAGALVEQGVACDWARVSGGHNSRIADARRCNE
jgi:endonuclease YncB( thermonuclease family)